MAPPKIPTPPISLNVRILALTQRHRHPYDSIEPKHAFIVRVLPDTPIREVCTHAGQYANLHLHRFVDGSRLEARDGNGYVFSGNEPVGQELGDGGDLYLIEEALDVDDAKKALLSSLDAKQKGIRTPKAKKVKEPRKTPSQRNLEIAMQGGRMEKMEPGKTPSRGPQANWVVRSEPKRKTLSMAPLELEDYTPPPAPTTASPKLQQEQELPEPLVESIEDSPPTTTSAKRCHSAKQLAKAVDASEYGVNASEARSPPARSVEGRNPSTRSTKQDDASTTLVQSKKDVPSATKQTMRRTSTSRLTKAEGSEALITAVASQRKLPPHITKAAGPSQDERVHPDFKDPPFPSVDAISRSSPMASGAPRASSEIHSRSARQQKAARAQLQVDGQKGIKQKKPEFLLGKPDPYDISAVLSDDEYYSPHQSNTIMSSSIRKLGSATKRTAPASNSVPRNSLVIANEPLPAKEHIQSPRRTKSAPTSQEELTVPATPLAHAPRNTSTEARPSSALGPLLSSPTNHVAAALARGRAQARRQPQLECVVIEDSDVEVYQDVLVDSQDQTSTSHRDSKSLEASLPWSAPPLRIGGEDPSWTLRTTGRRTSMNRRNDVDEGEDTEVKEDKALNVTGPSVVPTLKRDALKPQTLSTSAISSFNLSSPVRDPTKRAFEEPTRRSPAKSPERPSSQAIAHKPPLLLVHGSSSSDQGVEEIGYDDHGLANGEPGSPIKFVDAEINQESSSKDMVEDEDEAHDFMAGPLLSETLFGDEEPRKPRHILLENGGPITPDDNEADLPVVSKMPHLPVPLEDHKRPRDEPCELTRVPESDPKSDNFIQKSPTSGQPFKRKRELPDHIDSEEERRVRKKAKRETRAAKKAKRKRIREEKMAQEQEQRRKHETWLQEERKRLAMEKAYRRARELEIVVSSPSKAAEMGLIFSDASDSPQESELRSSSPGHAAVAPVFDGSDDSLGSKESEESQSWRRLSKKHLSIPPSYIQKDAAAINGPTGSRPLGMSEATIDQHAHAVLADHRTKVSQGVRSTAETNKMVRRKAFEDWAHLETAMGTPAYSPLQVHNRIHMKMILASLQSQTPHDAQKDEDIAVSNKAADDASAEGPVKPQTVTVARCQNAPPQRPAQEVPAQEPADDEDEDEDEDDITQQTARSPAPSPKDFTVVAGQASKQGDRHQQRKKDQKKNKRRKGKDNKRKKKWRRKDQPGICKQLKRKHTLGAKGTEH